MLASQRAQRSSDARKDEHAPATSTDLQADRAVKGEGLSRSASFDSVASTSAEESALLSPRLHGSVQAEALNCSHRSDSLESRKQPGGSSETDEDAERSLSWSQSFILWLMMLFMGTQLTMPFTLSVYLVRDFYAGSGASEQLIGQLTGLLAAAQSFSRSITAYPWGVVSDHVGRKACVLLGTLASMTSILGFGLSRSYTAAILARAIPALFVSSPVALKSMIGDSCDQTGQARAMAVFNLGHGLGNVLGPALGGVLAYPCRFDGMPLCHDNGLFRNRPFLLPCLVVVLLGAISFLASLSFLTETHPTIKLSPGGWAVHLLRWLCCRPLRDVSPEEACIVLSAGASLSAVCHSCADERQALLLSDSIRTSRPSDVEMGLRPQPSSDSSGLLDATRPAPPAKEEQLAANGARESEDAPSSTPRQLETLPSVKGHWKPAGIPNTTWEDSAGESGGRGFLLETIREAPPQRLLLAEANATLAHSREEERDCKHENAQVPKGKGESEEGQHPDPASSTEYRWWRDSNLRSLLLASGVVAFLYNFQDEIAPIYVSAPIKQGGLNMPLEEFTWPISFGGLVLVVFSLVLYPRLIKRYGPFVMARVGLLLGAPAAIFLPLASLFTGTYALEQVCVYLASSFQSMGKVCALNSSMIAVNLVAPKAAMGAVNGGSMSLQSAGRALGPLLSGSLWALVVTLNFAGQQFAGFSLVAVSFLLSQFLYSGRKLERQPS